MGEAGYKKLIVWQKADELACQIYLRTKKFPKTGDVWYYFPIEKGGIINTY